MYAKFKRIFKTWRIVRWAVFRLRRCLVLCNIIKRTDCLGQHFGENLSQHDILTIPNILGDDLVENLKESGFVFITIGLDSRFIEFDFLEHARTKREKTNCARKTHVVDIFDVIPLEVRAGLVRSLIDPSFKRLLRGYLGFQPILRSIRIFVSDTEHPVGGPFESSQNWHVDNDDCGQVKLVVNLVSLSDRRFGPFSWLPRQVSSTLIKRLGNTRITQDTAVKQVFYPLELFGPPGEGLLIDTSVCFHAGGRALKAGRTILIANYCSESCFPE